MKIYFSRSIIAIALLLSVSTGIDAQVLSPLNTYVQKARIGLVSEFFDRFNGKEVHPDILGNEKGRENNLMMLFDLSQFKSKEDSLFAEASKMMSVAMHDSIRIEFSDSTWMALAHCKGTLEGKDVKFDLLLTTQHRRENMYKWAIARADGDIFNITPRNDNEKIMLAPDDHETNFISLHRMTNEQPYNVRNFMSKEFDFDKTSVFAYLVNNGKIKIDYVEDLEFVFTQIPDYIFHVKYCDRESGNTGWLISKFYKSSKEDKNALLRTLHPYFWKATIATPQPIKAVRDTVVTKDFKDMFLSRRNEKLAQLNNYISQLQREGSTSECQKMIQKKIERLFEADSKIHLRYKNKSKKRSVSVAEFCELLKNGSFQTVKIDSICMPNWNDEINLSNESVSKIELTSSMYPVDALMDLNPTSILATEQVLYAYKEDTEDGIEWIPILGDMVVTVK